jgi:FkbM family methyltransferase
MVFVRNAENLWVRVRERLSQRLRGTRFEKLGRWGYERFLVLVPARLLGETERRTRGYDSATVEIAKRILTRDSGYVDAGANRGKLLEIFHRLAPCGAGYAFEPIPALAEQLRKRFPNVCVMDVALSDYEGREILRWLVDDAGNSSLRVRKDREAGHEVREVEVRVARLDDVVAEADRIALLKVDVEDVELEVLSGATRILTQDRPVVIVECASAKLKALTELLNGFGYAVLRLDEYLLGERRQRADLVERAIADGEFYFCAVATN